MAPMPAFMPIAWRIGPFTTAIDATALELLPRAVTPVAARARITGKYSGRAPDITAFTATFSTVYCQYSRKCGRAHPAHDLVGLAAGVGQHGRHALFGRQHDGEPVGPAVVEEQPLEVLRGVGFDEPWRRAVETRSARSPPR